MTRFSFLFRILDCFRHERWAVFRLLLVIGLATLVGLASVWPLAVLVDAVLVPDAAAPAILQALPAEVSANRGAQIVVLAVSVFVLRLLQEGLNGWRALLSVRIGHVGVLRVRGKLFRKLQELNLLFHRSIPQGDTICRLTRDAAGCQQVLNVLIEVAVAVFTLVVILAVMLGRSIPLTLVSLLVVPLLLMTNVAFGRCLRMRSRDARSAESDFTSAVQRAVSTISMTQVFGRQHDEHRHFAVRSQRSLDAWYEMHRNLVQYRLCVGLIFGAGTAVIFGWGGWLAWHDQILGHDPQGMTVGSLVVFVSYLAMLYDPLCKLSGAGANMLEGITGMERVFDVLDRPTVIEDAPHAVSLPVQPRTLSLQSASFAYAANNPVLRNVSLDITPGEMVAFVGGSGVGKSTILHLLCRFFEPTSGSLTIDGLDFRDVRLHDLRRHIAVVFQDNLMLPTSLAENIAYGRPHASLDDIRRAAELAGAAQFIESLPDGYATQVTEGGQNFSGGQRQRIAIARALLTEAPVLILDEPTSALDPESEQQIVATLRQLKGQRTIILVSHRLSTVADCDRILVMHEGHIVDAGRHDELLSRQGWYHQTFARQLLLPPQDESTWIAASA